MSLYLIDNATVTVNTVIIKFGRTIKISSLTNAKFIVQTDEATPVTVSNPFKTIDTLLDYNQISRTLTLYWNVILDSNTDYSIRLVGLVDSSNIVVPEESINFTSQMTSATPSIISQPTAPIVNEVLIEDKSVRSDIETGYQILAKNPHFYIETVDPGNGAFYLTEDENNGRVVIKFNERPASNFINSKYFKLQRKKIQRTPCRWENMTPVVSIHSWKPEVYVDLPSTDATPAYFTDGKVYIESNYKYRIIVSAEVGI